MSEEQKYHKTAYKKKTIVQLTPQTGESLVPAQALPTPTHSPKKEKTPDTLSKELKKVVQKALKKPRTLKRLISKLEKKNAWDQVLLKSAFVNAENQLVINL